LRRLARRPLPRCVRWCPAAPQGPAAPPRDAPPTPLCLARAGGLRGVRGEQLRPQHGAAGERRARSPALPRPRQLRQACSPPLMRVHRPPPPPAACPWASAPTTQHRHPCSQASAPAVSTGPGPRPSSTQDAPLTLCPAGCRPAGAAPLKKPARAAAAPAPTQQWKDIDTENKDNPLACSEYAQSIFEYLKDAEVGGQGQPVIARAAVASWLEGVLFGWAQPPPRGGPPPDQQQQQLVQTSAAAAGCSAGAFEAWPA
jgi:hypothetical protein